MRSILALARDMVKRSVMYITQPTLLRYDSWIQSIARRAHDSFSRAPPHGRSATDAPGCRGDADSWRDGAGTRTSQRCHFVVLHPHLLGLDVAHRRVADDDDGGAARGVRSGALRVRR